MLNDILDDIFFIIKKHWINSILDRFGPTMINPQNSQSRAWDHDKTMQSPVIMNKILKPKHGKNNFFKKKNPIK
jgi:hypothetical protein